MLHCIGRAVPGIVAERLSDLGHRYWGFVLATSKSGTLLLRRDQGEMAVL